MVTFSEVQYEMIDMCIDLDFFGTIKTCGISLYVRNYRIIKATDGIKPEAAGFYSGSAIG